MVFGFFHVLLAAIAYYIGCCFLDMPFAVIAILIGCCSFDISLLWLPTALMSYLLYLSIYMYVYV